MIYVTGSQLYIQLFTYRLKVFLLLQVQQLVTGTRQILSNKKLWNTICNLYIQGKWSQPIKM